MIKKWIDRIRTCSVMQYSVLPVLLINAFFQFYVIEMSFNSGEFWETISLSSRLVGICTVLFLDTLLLLLMKNYRTAMNISVFITSLLAVVNYFVLKFRGTPFTFVLIQNFLTAMNVISSYRFTLERTLCDMLLCTVIQLAVVNVLYVKRMVKRRYCALGTVGLLVLLYFAYLGPKPFVPNNVVGWSWRVAVKEYGYLPSMIKCTLESRNAVRKPDGYDRESVKAFVEDYEVVNDGEATPDVIVILNETFYDLNKVTELDTNLDALGYIHSLENSLQGYCFTPCEGGGTNVSEYELLTSNSIYLSPNSNPFNALDISGANSFATYLETLGYRSFAAHSEPGLNYSRDAAYPSLGFDEIHFEEDFVGEEYYCGRMYKTDASLYNNLIRWYEEMGEGPRVMYLLTIQNHANYDYLNENEYLVTVNGDYGDLTGQMNEFLTCIHQSDQAFKILVEYFEKVDRDVIICMMGDHAPIFVKDLVSKDLNAFDRLEKTCSVPYVIWSNNIDLSAESMPEQTCMPYIVPKTLQLGGIKLSAYYDYIVQLQEQIPFITSYGYYMDHQNKLYQFADNTPFTQSLQRYFDMAYANMTKTDFMMDG